MINNYQEELKASEYNSFQKSKRTSYFFKLFTMNKQKKIKIALVEDHEIVRNAIAKILREIPSFEFVFDAANGQEFLDKLNEKEIDVVLLDLEMPVLNGIETLKELKNKNSPVKVIMLTTHNDLDIAFELLSMGVNAYLLKESSIKEMVEAITTVYEKGNYTNKIMNDAVINSVATERKIKNRMFHLELSERELFVLKLICDGHTSKFIAGKILTSKKTVDYIRTQIMKKFDAKTSNELMRLSIINGLYTPRSNEEIMSEKENVVFALKIKKESKILHKTKKTK